MEQNYKMLLIFLPMLFYLLFDLYLLPPKRPLIVLIKYRKVLNKHQDTHLLVFFFISPFTVLVTPSINRPESSSHFMILIISFTSSFEMNKVNPFTAVATHFPLLLLSNLLTTFQVILLTIVRDVIRYIA